MNGDVGQTGRQAGSRQSETVALLDNCGVAAACAQFMIYDNTLEMR